jgi:hypothetical protein
LFSTLSIIMHVYRARNLTVQLVALDLASSTSSTIWRTRTGSGPQLEADRCEEQIMTRAEPLSETIICCDEDGRQLHFLETEIPTPLYIARADGSGHILSANASDLTTGGPTTVNPAVQPPTPDKDENALVTASEGPYALGVSIKFPRSIFARYSARTRHSVLDLRYDIFYNGEISESSTMSYGRTNPDTPGFGKIFVAGKRVDIHIAQPWAVVRNDQQGAEDQEEEQEGLPGGMTMAQRWDEINQLLKKSLDKAQIMQRSQRTPLLECLYTLAEMAMPTGLNGVPMTGRLPGIVDIVISVGNSKTVSAAKYLHVARMMPTRKFDHPLFPRPLKLKYAMINIHSMLANN